jgi:hypothetical protein
MAVIQVDSLGRVAADVQEISGDAAAADNAESDYDGTGYAKLNSTTGLIDNGVTAAKVATGAIDADAVAADVATELATGAGMLLAFGTCDGDSTTTTCEDAALTQADGFWSNWAAIVVSGHPARCVRGFVSASDRLTWTPALTSSAASVSYRLLAAPECRSFP